MLLEQLSDLATIALAVIGVPALLLAADQSTHARKARLAAIYLSISKTWDDLVVSRRFITDGPFEWRDAMTVTARAELLLAIKEGKAPFKPSGRPGSAESEVLRAELGRHVDTVLSYFEDIGLLCRQGYASQRDICDIIGIDIKDITEILLPTIESDRSEYEFGEAVYANALWLYERIRHSERFGLPGYGKPALFFRP